MILIGFIYKKNWDSNLSFTYNLNYQKKKRKEKEVYNLNYQKKEKKEKEER